MWVKIALAIFFLLSLLTAFYVEPQREHLLQPNDANSRSQNKNSLRLLSWNIGNGDLESETRAHTEDLAAVARVILRNDPDAVSLQELSGDDQLKLLLSELRNRYRGFVSSRGNGDRVEAVLVKNERIDADQAGLVFIDIPAGNRFAAAATFRWRKNLSPVVVVSAHADAFSAAARRAFVGEIVDWTRSRSDEIAFSRRLQS